MWDQFQHEMRLMLHNGWYYFKMWSIIIAIIWVINILNWVLGSPFNRFAIIPRRVSGLVGILISPILHRDFKHLLFNTLPLFVLGFALLVREGTLRFGIITLIITVTSGLAVWLIARRGIHLGASGVISGYFGYILVSAFTSPNVTSIVYAALAFYYFGGILIGILPKDKNTSWEAHLFGFLSGVWCAYLPLGNYFKF